MIRWLDNLPFSFRSLRVQALTWLIVPQLLMGALGIGMSFYAYNRVAESLAQSRDQEMAVVSADRLSENMLTYAQILISLANQDEMRQGDPALQQQVLQRSSDLLTAFDGGVLVLDARGIVAVTQPSRPDLLSREYSEDPSFLNSRALKTYSFSDIFQESSTGEELIVVSVPILNKQDEFSGAIIGRFYLRFMRLGEEINKLRVGKRGIAFLVDRNGKAIYHPDHSLLGSELTKQEAVSRLMHGERQGAFIATLEDNQRWVVGYAAVQATGWGLVTREPWADVIEPTQGILKTILLVSLVGVIIIALIVSLAINQVTKPIADLVSQIRQVSAGDYDARVEVSPILEIREVGREFNLMVDEISRYRAGIREYVAAITHSQEEERKRIARDLHDDTVQSLIAIGRQIEITRELLDDPEKAREHLSKLRRIITETIESVRQFSRDLRPLALEDLGLIPALQNLLKRLSQEDGIETQFIMQGAAEGLASDVEVTVYRIVQETLTNVRKHAQASRVQLDIEFLPNQVIVTVSDNGAGFTVPDKATELARSGSFGLMGLQERAQLFGGQLFINSSPGGGTKIKLVVPKQISPFPFQKIAKKSSK
jgi:signal transduction histidine kinase